MVARTQNEFTDAELMQIYYNLNNGQRSIFHQFRDRSARGHLHFGRAEALRAKGLLVRDSRFVTKMVWVTRTQKRDSSRAGGRWYHTWHLDSAGYRLVRLLESGA